MSILTWRNVDAPNLAGSAEIVGRAGERFSQSMSDLANGLGQFGQAQTDRADAAALQAASQITDSGAYAQALADGSILRNAGIDPTRVSGKVSQMLAERQNALLRNDFDRAQIQNQNQDNQIARDRFELDKAQSERQGKRDDYVHNRTVIMDGRQDAEYADNKAAQALAYQISQMGTDAAGARNFINKSGVSDKVKMLVNNALGLKSGGLIPTDPGSGTGGLRGADAVYGYGEHGQPEIPLSQGNFGTAHDFGQTLIPATRGKVGAGPDKGTSAVGAYQFTGDTMERYAKQVFGDNWREVPFTFDNQSKIAKALFEDSKDGNLKAVWAGLDDPTPGAYKNMSFEQFQNEVLPKESGMTLAEIRAQEQEYIQTNLVNRVTQANTAAQAIDQGMVGDAAQKLGNINLDQYFKDSENKDPDLTKAAASATKEYPSLKGTELNTVATWLDTIQQKAAAAGTPLTAAQATHILGASMSPSGTVSWHPFNGAESGLHFDETKMEQVLYDVNQGGNLGRSIVAKQIETDRKTSSDASANLLKALKAAEELRLRERENLPVDPAVRKQVNAALEKALSKREQLNQKLNDPAYQQKLTESSAEVARKQAAEKSKVAQRFAPVPAGTAQGIGYAPSTAITSGLPNQAATLLEQRISR